MIILAATPIGNLGDASARLIETFERVSIVAAEDTRHTAQLMRLLGVKNRPELISLHDHNERDRAPELAALALERDVLVVSDAGMPTISDPGFRLVQEAHRQGAQVTALPGPSAVMTALTVSGIATDRFTFEGFAPRKPGELSRALSALAAEPRTMVFFESPHRLQATLQAMVEHFGADRDAAVCRELTKLHEAVRRGPLADLAEWAGQGVRGEIVIVVAGSDPHHIDAQTALTFVLERVRSGERLKDASREVARETGVSARELYDLALHAKNAREKGE